MSVDDADHTIPLPLQEAPLQEAPLQEVLPLQEQTPLHEATEEFAVVVPPAVGPHPSGVPDAEAPQAPARAHRRWPLALAWTLVALLAVSLGVLGYGYKQSLDSSRAWQALADSTSSALDQARADLDTTTATLTKTRSALDGTQKALDETKGNLEAVAGQYNDASQRIRQLADEKAQVGDEAGLLATAVAQAGRLQQQLDTCVTGLRSLQTYLANATEYDPASLASYVAEVNAGCDEAQTQSAAFQQWLNGQ